MNGISSNLKEELKKNSNSKNKDKLKFFATIIISNIFVALICLPSESDTIPKKPFHKLIHPDHKMLVLPVTPLLSITDDSQEIPVSLISKNKKVLVKKAYIHAEVADAKSAFSEKPHFTIEIHDKDLALSESLLEEDMIAVPYVETAVVRKTVFKKGRSKYETNL